MRTGFFEKKLRANEYAKKKNKRARTLHYKVVRVSYHGKPGFEKARDGWEILVTHK